MGSPHYRSRIEVLHAHRGAIEPNLPQCSLASIHAANDAFAKETALLITNTDQAEVHTQTCLTIAASMQKQASEVCTTACNETQNVGSTIGSVVDQPRQRPHFARNKRFNQKPALTNLSSTISQQTSAINVNLNSISDKQSSRFCP